MENVRASEQRDIQDHPNAMGSYSEIDRSVAELETKERQKKKKKVRADDLPLGIHGGERKRPG